MAQRIEEIYQNYLDSIEFVKMAREADTDISWLEDKLDREDWLRLEEEISSYHLNNGKAYFVSGFRFAWELFEQCDEKKGVDDQC
jgi:hypothetical protein